MEVESKPRGSRLRSRKLPVILLALTCLSTFFAGACMWRPEFFVQQGGLRVRQTLIAHWDDGLIYMACVIGILFTHEMGHFLATIKYRVPSSLPFFIPLPIQPTGTLGAVIAMDGRVADRKQIFDIGIAGPLAGLAVALPVIWIGVLNADLDKPVVGQVMLECPLAMRWMLSVAHPGSYHGQFIAISQMNPYLMAGWFGAVITGLNMMPVSQLDGGHVLYTVFGKRYAGWFVAVFMVSAAAYVSFFASIWWLMLTLVTMIGVYHPPTSDDSVELGKFRVLLGCLSLSIPFLFFPPVGIKFLEM